MAHAHKRPAVPVFSASGVKSIPLAKAKASFSSVISNVESKRNPVTILRRGLPVAQIVPMSQEPESLYGCMKGTVREIGDIVGPTGIEWTVGDEL